MFLALSVKVVVQEHLFVDHFKGNLQLHFFLSAPPYPQRDRKRRLNGAVCRNHRIKRLVPCRC